jgi:predicted phage tail protein
MANQRAPEPKMLQAQVAPQPAERSTSEVIAILQSLDRRLTSMEQAIEQIKAEQFRRTRETVDLAGVKQLQENLAAPVNELAAEFKAAEERAARDRAITAEQLRLSQEQLAKINEQLKANQEQIERRKAAAKLQRAATVTRPPPQTPTTSAAPKPAPRPASAQAGAGVPQNSSPPQPAR